MKLTQKTAEDASAAAVAESIKSVFYHFASFYVEATNTYDIAAFVLFAR